MKKRKVISILLSLAVIAATLTGCGSSTSSMESAGNEAAAEEAAEESTGKESAAEGEKIITIAIPNDANTLDPIKSSDMMEDSMFRHLFSALTTQNTDMEVIPDAAESWELTGDDNCTWRFKLRQGIKFHDGSDLTAEDVKFSYDRSMSDEAMGNTVYAVGCMDIKSVEIVDDYTIDIITNGPNPIVPVFAAQIPITPKEYYESNDADFLALNPLGSGCYKLESWTKGDTVVMVKNPDYFGEEPEADKIIWRAIPEATTRLEELVTGGVDIAAQLTPDMVADVTGDNRVETMATGRRMYVGFTSYGNEALLDKRVRQAMNYAVDFDAINEGLLAGVGERMKTSVNAPWKNENIEGYTYDPEKALALMKEAGWEDTDGDGILDKDGEKLELRIISPNGKFVRDAEITQAVAADLNEIGVGTTVELYEWSVYNSMLFDYAVDDLWFKGNGSTFDGAGDISVLLDGDAINHGHYYNQDFEDTWKELSITFDDAERKVIFDKLQEILYDDPPYIFLYNQVEIDGVSNGLVWEPSKDERIRLFSAKFN